jgi:hypothetical protein
MTAPTKEPALGLAPSCLKAQPMMAPCLMAKGYDSLCSVASSLGLRGGAGDHLHTSETRSREAVSRLTDRLARRSLAQMQEEREVYGKFHIPSFFVVTS